MHDACREVWAGWKDEGMRVLNNLPWCQLKQVNITQQYKVQNSSQCPLTQQYKTAVNAPINTAIQNTKQQSMPPLTQQYKIQNGSQ